MADIPDPKTAVDDLIRKLPDIRKPVNDLLNNLPDAPAGIRTFAGCDTIFNFEQGQIFNMAKAAGGSVQRAAEENTQCARRKVQEGQPEGLIGYPVQFVVDNFVVDPVEYGLNWVRVVDKWVNKGPPIPNKLIPSAIRQKLGWGNQ
jgi:hypothetical protein